MKFTKTFHINNFTKKKLKTVEIIVAESPWEVNSENMPRNKMVKIRVDYDIWKFIPVNGNKNTL